jgi:hypothetical protein
MTAKDVRSSKALRTLLEEDYELKSQSHLSASITPKMRHEHEPMIQAIE